MNGELLVYYESQHLIDQPVTGKDINLNELDFFFFFFFLHSIHIYSHFKDITNIKQLQILAQCINVYNFFYTKLCTFFIYF